MTHTVNTLEQSRKDITDRFVAITSHGRQLGFEINNYSASSKRVKHVIRLFHAYLSQTQTFFDRVDSFTRMDPALPWEHQPTRANRKRSDMAFYAYNRKVQCADQNATICYHKWLKARDGLNDISRTEFDFWMKNWRGQNRTLPHEPIPQSSWNGGWYCTTAMMPPKTEDKT